MAPLLNPTLRLIALAACRRFSVPSAAEPLISCRSAQVRYSSNLVDVSGGFDDMLASTQRFYVIGGKGGVGRTSIASSLAVKFANQGEPTLIASMDPTHSLGDSFELEKGMPDSRIVEINGFDNLSAAQMGHLEVLDGPSTMRSWIKFILGKMKMEMPADPALSSKLDEILNKSFPAIKEAITISMLIHTVEVQCGNRFRRIVLDSLSTGYTLKVLSDADWIEKLVSLVIEVVKAFHSQTPPLSGIKKEERNVSIAWLRDFLGNSRQFVARAHEVLYNPESTEFITVTIPTMMAVAESSRYHASLKKDGVLMRRLVVNQVLPRCESSTAAICLRLQILCRETEGASSCLQCDEDRPRTGRPEADPSTTPRRGTERRPCPQILQ